MLATRQGLCRCSLMLLVCLCLWQHSWCCCTFLRLLFSRHLNGLFKAPVLFQVNFFHGIPNPEMRTFDAAPYLEKIKAWSCRFHWAFHGHVPLDFRPHGWETCRAFQAEIDVFQPHVVASASKGGWIGSSWFVLHLLASTSSPGLHFEDLWSMLQQCCTSFRVHEFLTWISQPLWKESTYLDCGRPGEKPRLGHLGELARAAFLPFLHWTH